MCFPMWQLILYIFLYFEKNGNPIYLKVTYNEGVIEFQIMSKCSFIICDIALLFALFSTLFVIVCRQI